ncbi:MAG TPA: IPT/TIG domain-containing protein [Anaeromyxobacteraceae bacterium]|nr:IPT/TIG domain-containing protein [Anaeromyxobacteraceae bacterium]
MGAAVVLALALLACGNNGSTPPPPPPGAPTVTGVSPTSGPARGGTALTITGTGFASGATVHIDGVGVSGATVGPAGTSITLTTSAHAAGTATVVVTNPDGQASAAASYAFVAAPVISSLSPGAVALSGGSVIIDGANFSDQVTVLFDGLPSTSASLLSATRVAAVAPPHQAGAVDVIVRNADKQQAIMAGGLTYTATTIPPATQAPTLALAAPNSGPTSGGTAVTLTGTNFDGNTAATFGGTPATVVPLSSSSLRVVTPPGTAGAVDVVVANAFGAATLAAGFTYTAPAPPTLASLTPVKGPSTGGTAVTLAGTGFDQPAVAFGAASATVQSFTATSISVLTPPGSGAVAVKVTNADGQSASLASAFTYTAPPPAISSLSPSSGPAGAATAVTITGTGFAAGASVAFGGTAATGISVASATTITCTSPALAAQTVNVVVTNQDGQASNPSAFAFAPQGGLPAPSISGMTPTHASIAGGAPFTITGTNFLAGATVAFGGTPGVNVVVGNTGVAITGLVPVGVAGPAPVVVRNIDGQTATFSGFSYQNPPPLIAGLNVEGQPVAGGSIFIAGSGFAANATVTFGGVASSSVVPDPTNPSGGLTVAVPPFAGALDPTFQDAFVPLVVTNPDGQSDTFTSVAGRQFHYGPPPAITSVTPSGAANPLRTGDVVTVTGSNFRVDAGGLQVLVGGALAPPTSATATQIVFKLPKAPPLQPPNTFPVVVTNFDKQSASSADRLSFH